MIAYEDLPVRPKSITGESLPGYVYRLFDANGHPVPTNIVNALKLVCLTANTHPWKAQDAIERIRRAVGSGCEIDEQWWVNPSERLSLPYAWWRWACATSGDFLVCPQCLKEGSFHAALWELPLVSACLIHRCMLVARCHACGQMLNWSELNTDWQCRCGVALTAINVTPASALAIAMSAVVAGAPDVCLPSTLTSTMLLSQVLQEVGIQPLRLEALYRAMQRFHDARNLMIDGLKPGRRARGLNGTRARPQPGRWELSLMRHWPEGLQDRLLRLAQRSYRGRAELFVAGTSAMAKVLRVLCGLQYEAWMVDPVHEAVIHLIKRFKAPLAMHQAVFFNPCLSPSGRATRIDAVNKWWGLVRECRSQKGLTHSLSHDPKLGHPGAEDLRGELVLGIINGMAERDERHVDPDRHSVCLQAWTSLDDCTKEGDELIYDLSWQLMNRSIWWLMALANLMSLPARNGGNRFASA